MSEFIGSRISLVSRSDIRYVGTLHEINSETSTVALENVRSFGTEGRKSNPDEEIPPAEGTYEYIVFRGSDVKDLRIEEAPAVKENKPPIPNDPAILGSGSRPGPPAQAGPPPPQNAPGPQNQQQGYPPNFYPPPQGWGRGAPPPPPGGPGFQGMPPYGPPPPGWYPPPGQGFPQQGFPPGPPGQLPYGGPGPYNGPGQFPPGPPGPQQGAPKPAPIGPQGAKLPAAPVSDKAVEPKSLSTQAPGPAKAQTPPVEPKAAPQELPTPAASAKPTPAGPKSGKIQPALPLSAGAAKPAPKTPAGPSVVAPIRSAVEDATQAAASAVAAAMAKLPPIGGQQQNGNNAAVDNLTKKVAEMRTNDAIRAPRHPGQTGFAARGGAPRGRGGPRHQETRKIEVPKDDFDFESSNAKFNKDDLVKEAIAGSPLGEHEEEEEVPLSASQPTVSYNKASSFFDDLSSEIKDRAEGGGGRPGGREWRGEEQRKNMETFGQGSVDNGSYRGGYRGRGRGRGRGGYRGRGNYGNGQAGARGGYRNPAQDSL